MNFLCKIDFFEETESAQTVRTGISNSVSSQVFRLFRPIACALCERQYSSFGLFYPVLDTMGGGNGLKSAMSRERNNAKKEAEGKGGGGKEGIKARTESALGTSCAICRAPFTSTKMKAQLVGHWETKHSKNTYAECFPNVPM